MPDKIPSIVLGGSGYVAGETVRLLLSHPGFSLAMVSSNSNADKRLDSVFPHLTGMIEDRCFDHPAQIDSVIAGNDQVAIFSALPHGETAQVLGPIVRSAREGVHVVDMSADFRFAEPARYEQLYKRPHADPIALGQFYCGAPDLEVGLPAQHISHPGCFATCIALACTPMTKHVDRTLFVSAVTGSTGSGATPRPGTHHPTRNGAMWAYEPLRHRHTDEITMMLKRHSETPLSISFVPHSGPFSRGIHATVMAKLTDREGVFEAFQSFYKDNPFITVSQSMPSLREVAGTNRCHIGVAVQEDNVAVTSVIDNLVKGAAGGAIQWMNRLYKFEETAGLMLPGTGWA